MRYTVDRIEGSYAVCEDENREMVNIPLTDLPDGVKEGDYLENGKIVSSDEVRKDLAAKMRRIFGENR